MPPRLVSLACVAVGIAAARGLALGPPVQGPVPGLIARLEAPSVGNEPPGPVHTVALSDDGRVLLTSDTHLIAVYSLPARKLIHRQTGHGLKAGRLALPGDGRRLARDEHPWGSRIFDLTTGTVVQRVETEWRSEAALFSRDMRRVVSWRGLYAKGAGPTELRVRDVRTGRVIFELPVEWSVILPGPKVAFSGDGKVIARLDLAITEDRQVNPIIRAYDVDSKTPRLLLSEGSLGRPAELDRMELTLSRDGALLAVWGFSRRRSAVRAWDTLSGRHLGELWAGSPVRSGAFSACGRLLATGHEDGGVILWELATMTARQRVRAHAGAVLSLDFSGNGNYMASGSADTTSVVRSVWPDREQRRDFDALWAELASPNAMVAFRAARSWRAAGVAGVRQLEDRLGPVSAAMKAEVGKVIRDLGSDKYEERQRASRAAARLAHVAEPALRSAMRPGADLEAVRRLKAALAALDPAKRPAGRLRELRAVELLERTGAPQAAQLLRKLSGGWQGASLTHDAAQALRRLKKGA